MSLCTKLLFYFAGPKLWHSFWEFLAVKFGPLQSSTISCKRYWDLPFPSGYDQKASKKLHWHQNKYETFFHAHTFKKKFATTNNKTLRWRNYTSKAIKISKPSCYFFNSNPTYTHTYLNVQIFTIVSGFYFLLSHQSQKGRAG